MSDEYGRVMQQFAQTTEAKPEEVAALRRFLAERATDERVSVALLKNLPAATPTETQHVRRAVERRARARTRLPWVLGFGVFGATGGLALAAAALLLLFLAWPQNDAHNTPLATTLEPSQSGPSQGEVLPLTDHVRLISEGNGVVSGTQAVPRIDWAQGKLSVEVTPGQGVALSVQTREALVRVIGTAFVVQRDALGTRIDVDHGRVSVVCTTGEQLILGAGEQITCLPTTAAGLLARANTLKTAGAPPREVLAAVEAGLPLATGPFRAELLALNAEMLLASGREADALTAARAYLSLGGPRRVEILEIAATAALRTEGCAGALPLLHALEDLGAGDPEALLRCEEQP